MVRPVGFSPVCEPSVYERNSPSFNSLASIARKCTQYAFPMLLLLGANMAAVAEAGPFTYLVCYGLCITVTKSASICSAQCMKHMNERHPAAPWF